MQHGKPHDQTPPHHSPLYVFGAIVSRFVCYPSDRRKKRGYHITGRVSVAVFDFIVSASALKTAARYTTALLYIGGLFFTDPLVNAWALLTLFPSPGKRAASAAI
jgi:hypothetical protein